MGGPAPGAPRHEEREFQKRVAGACAFQKDSENDEDEDRGQNDVRDGTVDGDLKGRDFGGWPRF